jgi:hypothetical protein
MDTTLHPASVGIVTAMVMPKPNLSQKWLGKVDGRDVDSIDEVRTLIRLALEKVQITRKEVIVSFSIEDNS